MNHNKVKETDNGKSPQFPQFPQFQGVLQLDKLTPALQKFVEMSKDLSDAPDEFTVSSLLAHWAGVVGNKLDGPYNLKPNVNIILFARSTDIRKSTSIKIAGKSFTEVQNDLDMEAFYEKLQYGEDMEKWKSLSADDKTSTSKPVKSNPKNLLLSSDFSDAGFFEMMKNNQISGVIVTGEYADFHEKLHRKYTGMGNAMLMAYDNDRMERQTRTHGTEIIHKPTFSILGATTFENFRKAFSDTELENGTMQRILPIVLTKPTKSRKPFLNRKDMDESYINELKEQIHNWLNYDDCFTIEITKDQKKSFSRWEEEFYQSSKKEHGNKIIPHVERMVPSCLKLAMLCESFGIKDPQGSTITLSDESLSCAISMINEQFLPSMAYLLENEVLMSNVLYNQKLIEKEIKSNGGKMGHSALLKATGLKAKDFNEAIDNLIQKQQIDAEKVPVQRPQGGGNAGKFYHWIDK